MKHAFRPLLMTRKLTGTRLPPRASDEKSGVHAPQHAIGPEFCARPRKRGGLYFFTSTRVAIERYVRS